METLTRIECDRLIAEFMGAKTNGASTIAKDGSHTQMYELEIPGIFGKIKYYDKPTEMGIWPIEGLKFHTSWDWLMSVVEKIESLGFSFNIKNDGCHIERWHYVGKFQEIGNVSDNKIKAVYLMTIAFIEWYNQQSKS